MHWQRHQRSPSFPIIRKLLSRCFNIVTLHSSYSFADNRLESDRTDDAECGYQMWDTKAMAMDPSCSYLCAVSPFVWSQISSVIANLHLLCYYCGTTSVLLLEYPYRKCSFWLDGSDEAVTVAAPTNTTQF